MLTRRSLLLGTAAALAAPAIARAQTFKGGSQIVRAPGAISQGQPVLDPNDPINCGLVGAWLFNGLTFDLSGFGNNGTPVGNPPLVPSPFGQAMSFNGSNQYVNVGLLGSWGSKAPNGYTLSAWINSSYQSSYEAVFGSQPSSNNSVSLYVNFAAGPKAGYAEAIFGNTAAGNLAWDTSVNAELTNGNWHLLTFVAIPSQAYGQFYVDGKSIATTGTGSAISSFPNLTTAMAIGRRNGLNDGYFNGSIGDSRIYSRALLAAEVMRLYVNPFAGFLFPSDRLWELTKPGGVAPTIVPNAPNFVPFVTPARFDRWP